MILGGMLLGLCNGRMALISEAILEAAGKRRPVRQSAGCLLFVYGADAHCGTDGLCDLDGKIMQKAFGTAFSIAAR